VRLLNFYNGHKILFAVHLKGSTFWASADVKPMLNHPVYARYWQCIMALSMCVYYDIYGKERRLHNGRESTVNRTLDGSINPG
jgi:hypothetical protein